MDWNPFNCEYWSKEKGCIDGYPLNCSYKFECFKIKKRD